MWIILEEIQGLRPLSSFQKKKERNSAESSDTMWGPLPASVIVGSNCELLYAASIHRTDTPILSLEYFISYFHFQDSSELTVLVYPG